MDAEDSNYPWFANLANYLAGRLIPSKFSFQQKKKLISDAKYYYWEDPFLYKFYADQVMRHCIMHAEGQEILRHCHDGPLGGHISAGRSASKVLEAGFFWLTIFANT